MQLIYMVGVGLISAVHTAQWMFTVHSAHDAAPGLCSSAVESLQLRLPMHSCTSAAQSALVESARAIKQGEDQENIAHCNAQWRQCEYCSVVQ